MDTATHTRSSRSDDDRSAHVFERLLVIQTTDLQTAAIEASQVVADALGAEAVHVFLSGSSGGGLVEITPPGASSQALEALALQVFQTGAPVVTGQAQHDLAGLPGQVGSLSCRPITGGDEQRGVLLLVSPRPGLFEAGDTRLGEQAARWVGLMLSRTERARQAARAAAEQAQAAAAERLIRGLAHDIGNVITPLKARIDMIERRARREERLRDRDDAIAAGHALGRLRVMVDSLIDAARLEQGLFTIAAQPVDLAAIVRETAAGMNAPDGSIKIVTPVEMPVQADASRLRQALEHLLANALKHGGSEPVQVSLTPERRDGVTWACLEVTDHGPGVDPALAPQIFDMFVASSSSNGLGLGLFLARGITEAHGGALTTQPTPGGGATFTLALPAGIV